LNEARPGPRHPRARSAIVALALLVPSCSRGPSSPTTSAKEEEKKDAIPVHVAPARREALSLLYSTSATLRADRRATVTARARGILEKLLAEEGDSVAEDEPLALLEDDSQRIELERAEALRDTKRRELARARELHGKGLLSDADFERIRREATEAEQAAALAELDVSRTVIRAPFAGRILRRYLDEGSTVSDGTPLYDLADLDPLYADVAIPERQVARLRPGQKVRVFVEGHSGPVEATIERLGPEVDPSKGTVKVTISVRSGAELRPGAFARVEIVLDTHPNALVVPRSALVAEGRRWHLFRVAPGGEGRVQKLEVRLGYEEEQKVEIAGVETPGASLEPGALVVVTGAGALTDGARIEIIPDRTTGERGEENPGVAS